MNSVRFPLPKYASIVNLEIPTGSLRRAAIWYSFAPHAPHFWHVTTLTAVLESKKPALHWHCASSVAAGGLVECGGQANGVEGVQVALNRLGVQGSMGGK